MNPFIETWKVGINAIITGEEYLTKANGKEYNREEETRKYAKRQFEHLEETKPNKNKLIWEQVNEEQKQFLIYLQMVMKTGKLEEQHGDKN